MMTGKFSPCAQQVLALANEEAERLNHNYLGTEHLMLGLIKLDQCVASHVLRKMGLDLDRIRSEVEKQVGQGPARHNIRPPEKSPRLKKVLALAGKEAIALYHPYVGPEHLLLGLLSEGNGVAARVLQTMHVDLERTRSAVFRELDPHHVDDARAEDRVAQESYVDDAPIEDTAAQESERIVKRVAQYAPISLLAGLGLFVVSYLNAPIVSATGAVLAFGIASIHIGGWLWMHKTGRTQYVALLFVLVAPCFFFIAIWDREFWSANALFGLSLMTQALFLRIAPGYLYPGSR